MDAMEYYKMVLEDALKKLFPDGIFEIRYYPGVGSWPYILDASGNTVDDQIIANILVEYIQKIQDRDKKRALLLALRHCLESFTHHGIDEELFQ